MAQAFRKSMREALMEIDEAGKLPRQLKDPKTEYMVSKGDTTIVIDKKDWATYKAKGWELAEEVELDNTIIDLFEEALLKEFTDAHIKQLQIAYQPLRGKRLSMDNLDKLKAMVKKMSVSQMKIVARSDIPFLASMTKTHLVLHKGMKWSDFKTPLDMEYKPEELDEAISPDKVKAYTRSNDHFGARIYVAQQMRDRDMETIYQGLELLQRKYGSYVGNNAVQTRDKLEKVLYSKINGKWGTKLGKDIIGNL